MVKDNSKQEETQKRGTEAEGEELLQATQRFVRSLFRTGVSLTAMPINVLPQEPREHFQTASREFILGLASLMHTFADGLENVTGEQKKNDIVSRKD